MSKTNDTKDTSKPDHAKLENRPLADSELDAVAGGATNQDAEEQARRQQEDKEAAAAMKTFAQLVAGA